MISKVKLVVIGIIVITLLSIVILKINEAPVYRELPEIYFNADNMLDDLSIKDLNHGNVEIKYNNDVVNEITGTFCEIRILTEEDALMALTSVRGIMNVETFSYACTTSVTSNGNQLYELQQLYNGIPVYEGIFSIETDNEGNPLAISGNYQSNVSCNIDGAISSRYARNIINKSYKIRSYELMVYKKTDYVSYPIWKLRIYKTKEKEQCYILLNAANGLVVDTIPLDSE